MQVFLRHVDDAEHAGIGEIEAEHHLAGVFRLAFDRKRHFVLVFGDIVGADVDLDIDRRLLLLRRQRGRRVRIFERQVLGVLRQHVQLGRRGRLGRRAVTVGHGSLSWSVRAGAGFAAECARKAKMPLSGRVAIIALPRSTRRTIALRASGPGLSDRRRRQIPATQAVLPRVACSKLLNMRDFRASSGFPLAAKTRYNSAVANG